MADSVRYKISVEPREELTDEQGNTKNVISGEVGKRLGGTGVAVVTDYSAVALAQGYTNGVVNYKEIIDSDYCIINSVSPSFVFIKNTGHAFSSATELGEKLTKSIGVYILTPPSTYTRISVLNAGEPFICKDDNAGINTAFYYFRTIDTDGSLNASAGHLAVEYLMVN